MEAPAALALKLSLALLALLTPSCAFRLFNDTSRLMGNITSSQARLHLGARLLPDPQLRSRGEGRSLGCSPHPSLKCLCCSWLNMELLFQGCRSVVVKLFRSYSSGEVLKDNGQPGARPQPVLWASLQRTPCTVSPLGDGETISRCFQKIHFKAANTLWLKHASPQVSIWIIR